MSIILTTDNEGKFMEVKKGDVDDSEFWKQLKRKTWSNLLNADRETNNENTN